MDTLPGLFQSKAAMRVLVVFRDPTTTKSHRGGWTARTLMGITRRRLGIALAASVGKMQRLSGLRPSTHVVARIQQVSRLVLR